jgi:hypothetical protein
MKDVVLVIEMLRSAKADAERSLWLAIAAFVIAYLAILKA